MHGKEEGGGGVKREGTKPPPRVCGWEKNYRSKQKRKKQVNALFILSLSPPLHF